MTYLRRGGGVPELLNLETDESRRHYVMALRDSVLLNDIVRKFGVQDVALLERLFHFLCANIGSQFSVNKLVNHLNSSGDKTNFETLARYVDHLEKALLTPYQSAYRIRAYHRGNRLVGVVVLPDSTLWGKKTPRPSGCQSSSSTFSSLAKSRSKVLTSYA